MNNKIISILFVFIFYSCELKLPESPEPISWYLNYELPLINTEYSFEGILQEGILTSTAEPYEDCGLDLICDTEDEDGTESNGLYDCTICDLLDPNYNGENFTDENSNGLWDAFGLTDGLENMIQIEFYNEIDEIGLGVVEEQLGMSFFKLDLSDVAIDPQVIQPATEYDLGANLPDPLMAPISQEIPIDIPETGEVFVDAILASCSDFIPSNNQTFSFDVGDFSGLPNPIEEANNLLDSNAALDAVEIPLDVPTDDISLGDLGDISVVKIILDDTMVWTVSFTNGLPFIIESLVFNIYKGPVSDNELFTSLTIPNIGPYESVSEDVTFNSYELTLDESLFAKVDINLDADQVPPENCPLNICVANGITLDDYFNVTVNQENFTFYDTIGECSDEFTGCDPCIGEDIHACTTDALVGGSVDINSIGQYGSSDDCTNNCDQCFVEPIHACTTDALVGDSVDINAIGQYSSSDDCTNNCDLCSVNPIFACIADGFDVNGNFNEDDITTYNTNDDCSDGCAPCIQNSLGLWSCVPGAAVDDPSLVNNTYLNELACQTACIDPECADLTTAVCVADAVGDDLTLTGDDPTIYQGATAQADCEAACNPCIDATTAVCVADAVGDDLTLTGDDPTIYQGATAQADCEAACNPCIDASTYICTTEASVVNGGSPTIYQGATAQVDCEAACDNCIAENLDGWASQDIDLEFELDGELALDAIVIDLTLNETPDSDPIAVPFPSFDQVQVREALIDDGSHFEDDNDDGVNQESELSYSNQFALTVDNGLFADAQLDISFNNIYEDDGSNYSESIIVTAENSSESIFDLSDKRIGDKDLGVNLENIEINYDFSIEDGQYEIPLSDNKLSIAETGYSASVSGMKLKSISAITEEISFPQAQSNPIQSIPDGFDDFKLYDVIMDMNMYNQIAIDEICASFSLTGKTCPDGIDCLGDPSYDSTVFPFFLQFDSANRIDDGQVEHSCNHEVGDLAVTRISINKDKQTIKYFCSEDDIEPYKTITKDFGPTLSNCSDTPEITYLPCCYEQEGNNYPCPCVSEVPIDFAGNDNLLDFIYAGPNQMSLDGSVVIDGEGTLREDDNLWGDFSLRAPLAFVFYEDWVFIPEYSEIGEMDESLSSQIQNSLVRAELNANFINNSPFGISMSMLVSNSTEFPLYIDDLDNMDPHCSDNLSIDENTCLCGDTGVWDGEECASGLRTEYDWLNYVESLTELGVSSISFQPLSNEDDRAYYVEFFGPSEGSVCSDGQCTGIENFTNCPSDCADGEEGVLGEEVLKFWVGRFIDFSFIDPQEVDPITGFVITPSESYSDEILDPTRISWITTSEKRYLAPMMTLSSTDGYPSSLQTTNYLGVESFLTLVLDTEGLNDTDNTQLVKYKITSTQDKPK